MTRSSAASYLDHYLAPLREHLERADVTDVYINQPGELWLELLGGEIHRVQAPELDQEHLWRLARQVASQSHQGISRQHPLLAASLPDGSRIQIVAPPATRGHLAIAIRRHAVSTLNLKSYQTGPANKDRSLFDVEVLRPLLDQKNFVEFLSIAIRRRLNVVISGGTSAGKTTLLNTLLAEVPAGERLIFIEDTPELRLSHQNSIGLIAVRGNQGETQVTSNDLLEAALRMRPDRIVLGELRGAEAFTFLRAINTGHPGSLTTVHADSPERAFIQLSMMVLQAGTGLAYGDVLQLVRSMVDVVVQVGRYGGKRAIETILLRT